MHSLDEIEIPSLDIKETQQQCYHIIQEEHCSFFNIIKRLCKMELTTYFLTALIGLVVLVAFCVLLPTQRMNSILIYFLLLGILATYEIYKQRVCNMEEIVSIVGVNTGKCFLYKCVICALLQLFCFFILMYIELLFFQSSITLLLFHSILPTYGILSIVILFERYLHSQIGVLVIYLVCYTAYFYIFLIYQPVVLDLCAQLSPYTIFFSCIIVFAIILSIHTKQMKKEGFYVWNLS